MNTGETIAEGSDSNGDSGGNPFKGLRILVVDDNKDDLHALEPALHSLGSKVTTCPDQNEATLLFRERRNKFDAILAKVDWKIGFAFFEYVWTKTNIPIIAISSAEDRNLIIEAINHGAYFVLVRPVRIDNLQRIWPFVLVYRKWALTRNQESAYGEAKDQSSRIEEGARGCKRSESNSEEVNKPHSHRNLMKKSRRVWTDERKRRFLEILQQFGEKNVTPKRILELMNEPELTNVNVSSHLKKYRLGLKKAKDAAAASAQQSGKNPESSDSLSSYVKRRRVGINEAIQINTEDIARQIARYSKPNAAPLPIVNGPSSRFLFENMRMQPYVVLQPITSLERGFNQHAQLCIRRPGPSDELSGRTLSFGGWVVNRDIAISNQVLDRGLPLEWQTPGLGERPSGYCLCHGHCGDKNLERRSRDVSYDEISSVLRVRQTIMDGGNLGATQDKGESSRGNWNAQNNGTEDPFGNGAPPAKTPSPRNSDSRGGGDTTDGEEADHSTLTCHCKYE